MIEGEVALTYLAEQPPEAEIVEGAWWPPDYRGALRASVEVDAAKGLGLEIGDSVSFMVFGRTVRAEVASFRQVDWGGFGVNTAFILSPGPLEAANPRHFAIAKAEPSQETAVIAALGEALPDVVVFQTREALAVAAKLFGDVAVAVNAAAGVVTLAGLLVLGGAFAAIARERTVESALLKTFGASRMRVLRLYAAEFVLVGGVAAGLGVAIGVAAAAPIVIGVFEAQWAFPIGPVVLISSLAVAVAAAGGGLVGAALLAQKPAPALRAA